MKYPMPESESTRSPLKGVEGLIFAVGTAAIFMLAFPQLLPVAGAALLGGLVLAPVLHRLYR